jgi:hypothetical protein
VTRPGQLALPGSIADAPVRGLPGDDLLTPRQAGEILHASLWQLKSWRGSRARRRPLPYYRIGNLVVYKMSDVLQYLETLRIVPGVGTGGQRG